MPHRERVAGPSRYNEDEWRIRIGGSMPADEDFRSDAPPATVPLAHNYVDPEGDAWLVTYHPPSVPARVHSRWQWFALMLVTIDQWPSPSFMATRDYASRYVYWATAAFHNPFRP